MNKQTSWAISYALNSLSFLLDFKEIKSIYLFGSATRGELTQKSDLDLFVDTDNEEIVKRRIKESLSRFYQSKDYEKWKMLKFTYPINVQVGKLSEWELKLSIISEGLILFSSEIQSILGQRKILFVLKLPKKKQEYLSLTRNLFGRNEKNYRHPGLVHQLDGEKISSTVLLVPQISKTKLIHYLNQRGIEYQMKEMVLIQK